MDNLGAMCPADPLDYMHDERWLQYGACSKCGAPPMPYEEKVARGIVKEPEEGFHLMSEQDITKMSDDEIRAQIAKLQQMQPPAREQKKPRRVGEAKPENPNRKKSWKDLLNAG